MSSPTFTDRMSTPRGDLVLTASLTGLTGAYFHDHKTLPMEGATWKRDPARFTLDKAELRAYFAGELSQFHRPLDLVGTDFQRRVWEALLAIPYGTTTTYGQLARTLGNPTGSRAVGAAVGKNPVSIIVPCHRVVGATGQLTGYAGGLDRKRWLLGLEKAR